MFDDILGRSIVSLEVEVAECHDPVEGCNEDKSQEDSDSLEQDNHRVDLDIVELLTKVIIELISIDEEVPTKQSRNSKTEEETLDIDDKLGNEEERGEDSKPFEQISVGKVADEGSSRTLGSDGGCE